MKNFRFLNKGEVINGVSTEGHITLKDLKEKANITTEDKNIVGKIGRNGDKTHIFKAVVTTIGDSDVLLSYYSACGAQSYKSGTAVIGNDLSMVTCQKCLKNLNK